MLIGTSHLPHIITCGGKAEVSSDKTIIVTEEMKRAGAEILWRELGFQFTPDSWDGERVASSIFQLMLALSPAGACPMQISQFHSPGKEA